MAGLGDVNGDGVPDVLVTTPGWNDSAGAVHVIYGHRGRNQGNIALYNGSGLTSSEGYTISDGNTPAQESPVYSYGNPWSADGALAGQVIEQTDETQCGVGPNGTCVFTSNYMWEPGDQAVVPAAELVAAACTRLDKPECDAGELPATAALTLVLAAERISANVLLNPAIRAKQGSAPAGRNARH